jgi:hypothetical protein
MLLIKIFPALLLLASMKSLLSVVQVLVAKMPTSNPSTKTGVTLDQATSTI